jgi:hypothetical protein
MKVNIHKLNEDDILEILIEHFQKGKNEKSAVSAKFFGSSGEDLRAVIVVTKKHTAKFDFEEIEKSTDFNGDHAFLNNHPEFDLSKPFKEGKTNN